MTKRLAVFASGGGTNFQAIINAIEMGEIDAEIALCIVSNARAYAAERALKYGIEPLVFDKNFYESVEEMFKIIKEIVLQNDIDYIILAGYMTILPSDFVKSFKGKIINIHPSLIPKYCGKGFYGMRVHRAVIDAFEDESGLTVHYVDEGVDTGDIILQKKVPVYRDDTPEKLQERILKHEHEALCEVVKMLCQK